MLRQLAYSLDRRANQSPRAADSQHRTQYCCCNTGWDFRMLWKMLPKISRFLSHRRFGGSQEGESRSKSESHHSKSEGRKQSPRILPLKFHSSVLVSMADRISLFFSFVSGAARTLHTAINVWNEETLFKILHLPFWTSRWGHFERKELTTEAFEHQCKSHDDF